MLRLAAHTFRPPRRQRQQRRARNELWRACLALAWLASSACNAILGNEAREPVQPQAATTTTRDASALDVCVDCDSGSRSPKTPTATSCSTLSCGTFADCLQDGGAAHCQCKPGYVLQNGSCEDQDECAADNGGCDANGTCINLRGSRACDCKTGYHHTADGDDACVSLCDELTCDAHATCAIVSERALCTCLAPYTGNGLTCTYDATCESHHCDPNARCLGGGPNPCVCSDGFEGDGTQCQRVDACRDQPCQHGGRCSTERGSYSCDCAQTGYRGATCEDAIDDCAQNPCSHGVCSDRVNGYECDCAAGYGGINCDVDIDDCAAKPCQHGLCMDLVHDYKCMCQSGYSGKNCDNDVDNCAGQPCAHGTCMDLVAGYSCQCPAGYDGVNCENNSDDCASKPCVHGTCSDQVAGFSCSCAPGYDGPKCDHDIDDCAAKPCQHAGTCKDRVNGFTCTCPAGWAGTHCETGSCANVKCPSSAPCRVPAQQAGLCYPADCGSMAGLCLAENADGSGNASTELLTEANSTFNFGTGNNWNKRSRYFAYLKAVQGWNRMCVFPETNYKGTPLVIALGQARSMSAVYGQSNSGPGRNNCP